MHGAVGGDLNRLHADALFGHTPNQALAVLAVKGLLIVKNLVGALATRSDRRVGTAILLNPSLDDRNLLGNLAVGHLVVLSALRSLFAVLALDLNDLSLLLLNLGERHWRGNDLEQLPAQDTGQSKRRTLAVSGLLRLLGGRIVCSRFGLLLGFVFGICLSFALLLWRGRALLRTFGLVPLRRLALGLLPRGLSLRILVLRRCLLGHSLGI